MMVNEKKGVIICKVKKGPVEDSFGIWTWTGEKSGIDYVNEIRDETEQRLVEKGIEKPFFQKESFTKETLLKAGD
jgi:hypothetical protein